MNNTFTDHPEIAGFLKNQIIPDKPYVLLYFMSEKSPASSVVQKKAEMLSAVKIQKEPLLSL